MKTFHGVLKIKTISEEKKKKTPDLTVTRVEPTAGHLSVATGGHWLLCGEPPPGRDPTPGAHAYQKLQSDLPQEAWQQGRERRGTWGGGPGPEG